MRWLGKQQLNRSNKCVFIAVIRRLTELNVDESRRQRFTIRQKLKDSAFTMASQRAACVFFENSRLSKPGFLESWDFASGSGVWAGMTTGMD